MRKVNLIFEPGKFWQRHISGVYKITFGHRFYIGRSHFIFNRWASHYRGINKALNNYPELDFANEGYYENIIRYLLENPKINIGYIQVINECTSFDEMWYMENWWMNSYRDNPDCLNVGFYSNYPSNPTIKFMVETIIHDSRRYFYNPLYEQLLTETDEVSSTGKKRKSEKYRSDAAVYQMLLQQIADKYGKLS